MFTWIERMLPIAERERMMPEITEALVMRGSGLFRFDGRPRRWCYCAAPTNGPCQRFRGRPPPVANVLCFYEQFADPVAGLALAREGLDYASRTGSSAYGFLMVGNGAVCALRAGEWGWARQLIEEWLMKEIGGQLLLELFADRAVYRALIGEDARADIAAAEERLPDVDDTQYESYVHWAKAWASLTRGDFEQSAPLKRRPRSD